MIFVSTGLSWKMSCLRPSPPTRHYLAQVQEPAVNNRRSVNINKKPVKGLNLFEMLLDERLLCISTSKWVLHSLFDGGNHLFQHFNIFFCHNWKKAGEKVQNRFFLILKKGVYQWLDATPKLWQ